MLIADFLDQFISHLTVQRRMSHNTISAYTSDLNQFVEYCKKKGFVTLASLSQDICNQFFVFLKREQGLSRRSMARKVASLRAFLFFLSDRELVHGVAFQLTVPKQAQSIPKVIPYQYMNSLMALVQHQALMPAEPTRASLIAARDAVLVHVLYATGMRVSELVSLTINDVYDDESAFKVHGKGSKERLIPFGHVVKQLLQQYMFQVRPLLLDANASQLLFPHVHGTHVVPLTRQCVWRVVATLGKQLGCRLSPHMLRHSMATHLLQNGADLRSVQILLGHEHVTTTQIYTHVDTHQLRAVYDKLHHRK